MRPLALLPLAVALAPNLAVAQDGPSFDCRDADTRTEIAICASPELARLELRMFGAYQGLVERLGEREARAIADELLLRRQACEGDPGCVAERLLISMEVFDQRGRSSDLVAELEPAAPEEEVAAEAATLAPEEEVAALTPPTEAGPDIPLAAQAPAPLESAPIPPVRRTPAPAAPIEDDSAIADALPVEEIAPPAEPAPVQDDAAIADAAPIEEIAPPAELAPIENDAAIADAAPNEEIAPPAEPAPVEEPVIADAAPVEEIAPPAEPAPIEDDAALADAAPVEETAHPAEPVPVEEPVVTDAAPVEEIAPPTEPVEEPVIADITPEASPAAPEEETDLASADDTPDLSETIDSAELASSDGGGEAAFDTPVSWAFMDLAREDRAAVQTRLQDVGLYAGPVEGSWNNNTRSALETVAASAGAEGFDLSSQNSAALLLDYVTSDAFTGAEEGEAPIDDSQF